MNEISDPPNDYNFGLDFNYALWTPSTRVTLVNVPWNNDYRDIVSFDDRAALNTYIDSLETSGIVINNLSYLKPNQPIRIDVPFNTAYRYNYLRASNPIQPVSGDTTKDFYYFITDVRYLAPNTTEVVLQLDVWQTFGYDITFGNSYIERGHIGVANENNFDNFGRDYLTIPEGLDVGGEYVQVARRSNKIMDSDDSFGFGIRILVVSTVKLEADPGTVEAPVLKTAEGTKFQGLVSGASYYLFDSIDDFRDFLAEYSDKPWITQGIISITAIPNPARYGYFTTDITSTTGIVFKKFDAFAESAGNGTYFSMFTNWRDSSEILNHIPSRYRHLRKFFTYPYMVIEMTAWTGKPIILKPESWADANAFVNEKPSLGPPNQRIVIWPRRYNAKIDSTIDSEEIEGSSALNFYDDGGEYLDKATQISQFPTFAIVNNMAIAFMASNANSLNFMERSADWSQSRALASNQVTYDQQKSAIETSRSINALERAGMGGNVAADQLALRQSVAANGIAGVVTGAALGGGKFGFLGGMSGAASQIMGGVNADINVDRSNTQLAVNQNVSRGSNIGQTNQSQYVADTNKSLADWAAKGDYANTIAGINAKVQDAQLLQPSTAGQVGGEAFNIIHNAMEISLRWKMLGQSEMRVIGEYWLRYGYSVRQFAQITVLNVMTKFTYWKLSETYISSAFMPEAFKQAIRGIFEKGVTVWSNPNDIGNIDIADNEPVEGIVL